MITSRHHRWVKNIRRLRRSKDTGRLLLDGPRLLEEALDGGLELDVVLASEAFLETARARRLLPRLPRPPLLADERVLTEITDVETTVGVVAVARRPPTPIEAFEDVELVVYLDGVQDPGNVGALARVAEASGAGGMVMGPGCARPEHPRALRGSAGSLFRLPVLREAELKDGTLGDRRWIGLATRGATSLWEADLEGPLVLVAGGEGAGIRPEVEARLDARLTIPLEGPVESLNVAVATGVVLFERARRLRSARGLSSS